LATCWPTRAPEFLGAILAGHSREALGTPLDFFQRSGEILLARVAELNDGK
jgi:hypothetical protein